MATEHTGPLGVRPDKAWRTGGSSQLTADDLADREMTKYGTPAEYVAGSVEIDGKTFLVDRRVYIPNRESQILLDAALPFVKPRATILDVGTGCGWLAILIKLAVPTARVLATDIEAGALEVARTNARFHGVSVEFFRSSLCRGVDLDTPPDVVIADLPYGEERHALSHEAGPAHSHLPVTSTFPTGGPLSVYGDLLDAVAERGWQCFVFCEIGLVEDHIVTADLGRPGFSVQIRRREGHGVAVFTPDPSRGPSQT